MAVGEVLVGRSMVFGQTKISPCLSINDYSRKEVDMGRLLRYSAQCDFTTEKAPEGVLRKDLGTPATRALRGACTRIQKRGANLRSAATMIATR